MLRVEFNVAQHGMALPGIASHGREQHSTAHHGTARRHTAWYGMDGMARRDEA